MDEPKKVITTEQEHEQDNDEDIYDEYDFTLKYLSIMAFIGICGLSIIYLF